MSDKSFTLRHNAVRAARAQGLDASTLDFFQGDDGRWTWREAAPAVEMSAAEAEQRLIAEQRAVDEEAFDTASPVAEVPAEASETSEIVAEEGEVAAADDGGDPITGYGDYGHGREWSGASEGAAKAEVPEVGGLDREGFLAGAEAAQEVVEAEEAAAPACGEPLMVSDADPSDPAPYCAADGCDWQGERAAAAEPVVDEATDPARLVPPDPAVVERVLDRMLGIAPDEPEPVAEPEPIAPTPAALAVAARDQAAILEAAGNPEVARLLRSLAAVAEAAPAPRSPKVLREPAAPRAPRQRLADRDWTVKPLIASPTNQGVQRLIDRIDAARGDLAALRAFQFSRASTYYALAGRFLDALIAQAEAEAAEAA